jgi:hypothetical protein
MLADGPGRELRGMDCMAHALARPERASCLQVLCPFSSAHLVQSWWLLLTPAALRALALLAEYCREHPKASCGLRWLGAA